MFVLANLDTSVQDAPLLDPVVPDEYLQVQSQWNIPHFGTLSPEEVSSPSSINISDIKQIDAVIEHRVAQIVTTKDSISMDTVLPVERKLHRSWNVMRQQVTILMSEVMAKEDRIRELDCPLSLDNDERRAWACGCLSTARRFVACIHDSLAQMLAQKDPPSDICLIDNLKGRIVQVRKELDIVTDILARDVIPRLV